MSAPRQDGQTLGDIVDQLHALGQASDRVSVADVREAFGERSVGPFLIIPALVEISPIGAVPGLPTLLAVSIILFAAQIVFGRRHLWIPQWVARREIDGKRLRKAADAVKRPTRWVDRIIKPRLTHLVSRRLLALACVVLCLMVPALEVLPFASTVPMFSVILLGLAIMARDGLIAVAGLAVAVGSAYLMTRVLLG